MLSSLNIFRSLNPAFCHPQWCICTRSKHLTFQHCCIFMSIALEQIPSCPGKQLLAATELTVSPPLPEFPEPTTWSKQQMNEFSRQASKASNPHQAPPASPILPIPLSSIRNEVIFWAEKPTPPILSTTRQEWGKKAWGCRRGYSGQDSS